MWLVFFFSGTTVFYSTDVVSGKRSIELAANTKGFFFIRASRPATAIIHKNYEVFEVIICHYNIFSLYTTFNVDKFILTITLLISD